MHKLYIYIKLQLILHIFLIVCSLREHKNTSFELYNNYSTFLHSFKYEIRVGVLVVLQNDNKYFDCVTLTALMSL